MSSCVGIGPANIRPALIVAATTAGAVLLSAWLAAGSAAAQSRKRGPSDWGTISDNRYGFQIAYPAAILFPVETPSGGEGRVLQSADGKVKLLIATFRNEQKLGLDAYRQFLLDGNYAGTRIDYQPVRNRWFVLSGERGGFTFYERVTFSCGGDLINSWAMIYPTAEKRRYDPILETIAKTYSPGAGRDGNCRIDDDGAEPGSSPAPQAGRPDDN